MATVTLYPNYKLLNCLFLKIIPPFLCFFADLNTKNMSTNTTSSKPTLKNREDQAQGQKLHDFSVFVILLCAANMNALYRYFKLLTISGRKCIIANFRALFLRKKRLYQTKHSWGY